ncbi:MAG: transcriptional repressor [Micropruina sp.]|nr:MAG: transcriptional repressor [Micropruina sp.]
MTEQPRRTRQRAAVEQLLQEADGFRTAQELHDALRHQGATVGLATVYRTLQALADAGEVDVLRTPDGQAAYRSCSSGHHHHLVCRRCGRTVEVAAPEIEAWARRMAAEHGFSEIGHEVELSGVCADC